MNWLRSGCVGSVRRMVELIGTICRGTIQSDALCRQVYDDRFLLPVLPRLDRDAAVDLGKQLQRRTAAGRGSRIRKTPSRR